MTSQKFSQLDQFANAANDLTNKIATKVQTLLDDLKGGVTTQEADALIQKNQGIVDALNASRQWRAGRRPHRRRLTFGRLTIS
jgi:hypothetical protein